MDLRKSMLAAVLLTALARVGLAGSAAPQAKKYTQWPGAGPNKGKMGDPVFDNFAKTQVQFLGGGGQPGNGHEMMLEKNSDGIAAYFETWLEKNVH